MGWVDLGVMSTAYSGLAERERAVRSAQLGLHTGDFTAGVGNSNVGAPSIGTQKLTYRPWRWVRKSSKGYPVSFQDNIYNPRAFPKIKMYLILNRYYLDEK